MSLVKTGFIPLPQGARPGFDHADVYRAGRRLYVAHTGADRVEVIDCAKQAFLRSLPDLPGVAGVLVHEPHDLLFTSDREAAQVTVFHCSDERRLGRAGVGLHPNGLAYDSRRRLLYAFNLGEPLGENCTVSVVDVDSLATVSELPLPGRPRWAVYDEEEDRIYVNIREPGQIVAIDPDTRTIAGTLDVPSSGPHGLWLDRGRLFCAADGGDLVVLSLAADILASVALPGAPDVVMHDAVLRRLYVAIGEPGVVWSFDTDRLVHLETIATEEGAHTLGLDPIEHRLYVFQPRSCGASVYEERA